MLNKWTKILPLFLFPLAMAREVDIYLKDGVTVTDYAPGSLGGSSKNRLSYSHPSAAYWKGDLKFKLHIPGIGDPDCYLVGDPGSEFATVSFEITAKADYLDHCNLHNGVAVVCNGPSATCGK